MLIPATPTSAVLRTFSTIVFVSYPYPASISAETGIFTFSVTVLMIAKCLSKSINSPSAYSSEFAIPQLVVPIA